MCNFGIHWSILAKGERLNDYEQCLKRLVIPYIRGYLLIVKSHVKNSILSTLINGDLMQELLYLYGFVIEDNTDDYLMVNNSLSF